MNREEAIKIIDCYDIGFYDLSGEKIPADKLADAFDMAIESLSVDAEPKWSCTANFVAEQLNKLEDMTVNEKLKLIQDLLDVEFKEENLNYEHATLVDIKEPLKVAVVRCKDCRYAHECHKCVQYTRNGQNTVTIGYSPIEWCSRGERREKNDYIPQD